MKKFTIFLLALPTIALFLTNCEKDDHDDETNNTTVVIKDEGTISDESRIIGIDDKTFYLDYIKYTVSQGHLVVVGYDNVGFDGIANIASKITYKGNSYEVLEINFKAFSNLNKLTSLTIPSTITKIGGGTFAGSLKLKTITCKSITPPQINPQDYFYGSRLTFPESAYSNATVYVPKGSLDRYKTAEGWKNFTTIIEK